MRRNYIAMAIVFSLHLLFCVILWVTDSWIPIYLVYIATLPVAIVLAGVVDLFQGLKIKNTFCRLLSLSGGGLSVLAVLFTLGIDPGLKVIPLFCVGIVACWILRGIWFHRKNRGAWR